MKSININYKPLFFFCLIVFSFLISSTSVLAAETTTDQGAKTRLELLKEFVQDTYLNDSFCNELGQNSTVESTYYGVLLADYLKIEYDLYDVIFFFQKHQKNDYGFSNHLSDNTTINATFFAVHALKQLGLASESLNQWQIFQFLNDSISSILYHPSSYSNLTTQEINSLTRFFLTATTLNQTVLFPYNPLVTALKQFQFTNGTFPSFYHAIEVSSLLTLFEQSLLDVTGAIRYLKSFRFNNTGFTKDGKDIISIRDTYHAISTILSLGGEIENKNKLTDAILDLQSSEGGFMDKKGLPATLESSYLAYQILVLLNNVDSLNQLAFLQSTGFLDFSFTSFFVSVVSIFLLRFIGKKKIK